MVMKFQQSSRLDECMGLEERRKIKELREVTLPDREKELVEITGAPIRYDVDWDSLGDDLEGLRFLDNLSCHRLNMALRVICMDELGKEAVAERLQTVKLRNVKDKNDMKIGFSGGVLEMQCAYALRTEGMYSDGDIRQVLLKGL
jgi:hypothetical protein